MKLNFSEKSQNFKSLLWNSINTKLTLIFLNSAPKTSPKHETTKTTKKTNTNFLSNKTRKHCKNELKLTDVDKQFCVRESPPHPNMNGFSFFWLSGRWKERFQKWVNPQSWAWMTEPQLREHLRRNFSPTDLIYAEERRVEEQHVPRLRRKPRLVFIGERREAVERKQQQKLTAPEGVQLWMKSTSVDFKISQQMCKQEEKKSHFLVLHNFASMRRWVRISWGNKFGTLVSGFITWHSTMPDLSLLHRNPLLFKLQIGGKLLLWAIWNFSRREDSPVTDKKTSGGRYLLFLFPSSPNPRSPPSVFHPSLSAFNNTFPTVLFDFRASFLLFNYFILEGVLNLIRRMKNYWIPFKAHERNAFTHNCLY